MQKFISVCDLCRKEEVTLYDVEVENIVNWEDNYEVCEECLDSIQTFIKGLKVVTEERGGR